MSTITRTRGTILTLLDITHLQAEVLATLNAQIPEDSTARYVRAETSPLGIAVGRDGVLYAVCTEGVGWEVTEDKPLTIDFRASWTEYEGGPTNFSVVPSVSAEFSLAEVLAMRGTEEIDLADLVRSFGSRLETNFNIWKGILGDRVRMRDAGQPSIGSLEIIEHTCHNPTGLTAAQASDHCPRCQELTEKEHRP